MVALVAACEAKVRDELRPALAARMSAALGDSGWAVESDSFDAQSLIFRYPSAFAEAGEAPYIQRNVKIEGGARADAWPTEDRLLYPYVAEAFPAGVRDAEVSVRVLSVERTFWEKATILHADPQRAFQVLDHHTHWQDGQAIGGRERRGETMVHANQQSAGFPHPQAVAPVHKQGLEQ